MKKVLLTQRTIFFVLLTCLAVLKSPAFSQPGKVLFSDNFGKPVGRIPSPYANTGNNEFSFSDPDFLYPPFPPLGAWTTDPQIWRRQGLDIESNHYAIVAPNQIFSSVPDYSVSEGYPFPYTPTTNGLWSNLIALGVDADNDPKGGVMAVNAGTTPGIFYTRHITLERGKFYRFSYALYVENPKVLLRTDIFASGGTRLIGDKVEAPFTSTNHLWFTVTEYIYLPNTPCAQNDDYYISLQSIDEENNGDDFAIDNIRLQEVASTDVPNHPDSAVVIIPCVSNMPGAGNDISFGNNPGEITLNILANDTTKDGYLAEAANFGADDYVTFDFVVPPGSSKGPGNNKLTVYGEGVWLFNTNKGEINFKPEAGFTGNPTPIQYTITQQFAYTGADAPPFPLAPEVLSSEPATITIAYGSNPLAVNDTVTGLVGDPIDINILSNDFTSAEVSPVNPADVTIHLRNPSTGVESLSTSVVPGEGVWSYNSGTGMLHFVPAPGFFGTPTPITYTFYEGGDITRTASAMAVVLEDTLKTTITGKVLIDGNGTTNGLDGIGYNKNDLYVLLVDPKGYDYASTRVLSNGDYVFTNVPYTHDGANFQLILQDHQEPSGDPAPQSPRLPATPIYTWTSTEEQLNLLEDGSPDSRLSITLIGPLTNANFGIQQMSGAEEITTNVPPNLPLHTIWQLDNDDQVLMANDPEDGNDLQAGASFVITDIDPNIKLYYKIDGVNYREITSADFGTVGQQPGSSVLVINNYDPIMLAFEYNADVLSADFKYALVDNANVIGNDALYIINKNFLLSSTGLVLEASRKANGNQLRWKTATETATRSFIIERSVDGIHFKSIGHVAAAGNSNSLRNYSFTDSATQKTSIYYRVLLESKNESVIYSNMVFLPMKASTQLVHVFPNPVQRDMNIALSEAGNYKLNVLDTKGRKIFEQQVIALGNATVNKIKLPALTSGMYYLQVTNTKTNVQATTKLWVAP